jgi:hypothetical protein
MCRRVAAIQFPGCHVYLFSFSIVAVFVTMPLAVLAVVLKSLSSHGASLPFIAYLERLFQSGMKLCVV